MNEISPVNQSNVVHIHQDNSRILGASDIFGELAPIRWLAQGLELAPGAPALLAGYGYAGKSIAAQDLALAVATGGLAWGRFPCRSGRVLHLDYEQGRRLTSGRYQGLLRGRCLTPAAVGDRLKLNAFPAFFLGRMAASEIVRILQGYDLAIIDSFRASCPWTDENSSAARLPLDALGRASERTGCVVLMVHHARKPAVGVSSEARYQIRGSGALFDACASVIVFQKEWNMPTRVVHEKARISGKLHPPFSLYFTDLDQGGLRVESILEEEEKDPRDR